MCPGKRGKPVNCRLQDSKGTHCGWERRNGRRKEKTSCRERFEVGQRKLRKKNEAIEREIRQ